MIDTFRSKYLETFTNAASGDAHDASMQAKALEKALDIRKFEIGLYWTRAAYFWTFIGATFAGYFALQKVSATDNGLIQLVASLGFLFSLGWYFVNRGSKAWQQNWELHVDLLEDDVIGPLYKTILEPRKQWFFDIAGPYKFSPSKINQLLSLFVTVIWGAIVFGPLVTAYDPALSLWLAKWGVISATAIFALALFFLGKSGNSKKHVIPIETKRIVG